MLKRRPRDVILGTLVRRFPNAMTLSEISERTGISPSGLVAHLKRLVAEGTVEPLPEAGPHRFRYRAVPRLQVEWIDPTRRFIANWSVAGDFSWRFPLVSRVPDAAARRVLHRFLREADLRGFFHPWLLEGGDLSDPSLTEGLTLVVYGSCARGDAQKKSDLDLLVIEPPKLGMESAFRSLAAEANLWAERKIDLRIVARDSFFDDLPAQLRTSIIEQGITVFSSFEDGEFGVEALRSEEARS
jgi:predicted nucleotidyltransferase